MSDDRQTLVVRLAAAVQRWDLPGRSLRGRSLPHAIGLEGNGSLTLDGPTLLTLGPRDTVCRWDLRTGEPIGSPLHLAPPAMNGAGVRQQASLRALSPDGRTLAVAVVDRNNTRVGGASHVQLWDLATGRPRPPSPTVDLLPHSLTFNPDGRVLAVTRTSPARKEDEIQLYDAASGQLLGRPLPQPGGTSSLAFSADDRLLVTACSTFGVHFWETATGQAIGQPATDAVATGRHTVAVGRLVVAAPISGGPRLWDLPSVGVGWLSLPAPKDWAVPNSVSTLSPDGRELLMGGVGSTLPRRWDLPEPVSGTGRQVQSWVRERTGTETDSR